MVCNDMVLPDFERWAALALGGHGDFIDNVALAIKQAYYQGVSLGFRKCDELKQVGDGCCD